MFFLYQWQGNIYSYKWVGDVDMLFSHVADMQELHCDTVQIKIDDCHNKPKYCTRLK
jgi:hypothetical protein